jgi:hypothetical protein
VPLSSLIPAFSQSQRASLPPRRVTYYAAKASLDAAYCKLFRAQPRGFGFMSRPFRGNIYPMIAAAIAFALMPPLGATAEADDSGLPRVAFFGLQLINTSLEPTTPIEDGRVKMLDDLFREKLDHSGRFKIVPIPPDAQQRIAGGAEISGCNGCERDYAKSIGANWAAWGTVQKVSNLILNINLYMENAASGKLEFVKSVDIRGNNDESWRHGLDYMLRHYLFEEP